MCKKIEEDGSFTLRPSQRTFSNNNVFDKALSKDLELKTFSEKNNISNNVLIKSLQTEQKSDI
jgi:hypothetical protein